MPRGPQDWATDVRRVKQLLYGHLGECKTSRKPVVEMLKLLERLDDELRSASAASETTLSGQATPQHRRNKPKRYRIERHGNADFLAEHREGGRQPYLCPEDVYDAFAAVMAKIAEPAHFEVLLQAVTDRTGRPPPDYLLRTCVRFWMRCEPALVEKVRTRYRPIRPSRFVQEARRSWRRLAHVDKE